MALIWGRPLSSGLRQGVDDGDDETLLFLYIEFLGFHECCKIVT